MKKMKKLTTLLLAAAMVMAITACGSSSSSSSDTSTTAAAAAAEDSGSSSADSEEPASSEAGGSQTDTVNIRIASDPGSLQPWGTQGSGPMTLRACIYETLYTLDPAVGEYEPLMAKDMEEVDQSTYLLTIYDNITDTEGNNITASDIVFSFDTALETGNLTSSIASIESMEIVDDYTVQINLGDDPPVGSVYYALCTLNIVSQAAYEASPDGMATDPVGTSPYVMVDSISSSYWDFDLRDDYWGNREGTVPHIHCALVTDGNAAAVALETGELDSSMLGTAAREPFVNADGSVRDGYQLEIVRGMNTFLEFNCDESSPCSDVNLRKAIAYCLDRTALGYQYNAEYAPKVDDLADQRWMDGDFGQQPDDYYNQDLELAKEYLDKSSYNGETLRFLVHSSFDSQGPLIQSYCAQIGIDVELLNYDRATYTSNHNSSSPDNYDFAFGGYSTTDYAWRALSFLDEDVYEGNINRCYIHDQELQDLYDATKYSSLYTDDAVKNLCEYVDENCYAIGLFRTNYVYISNASIIDTLAFTFSGDINPGATLYE